MPSSTPSIPRAPRAAVRKIRGADFWARYQQGVWSEHLLLGATNALEGFFAIPYGCSGAALGQSREEVEAYFATLAPAEMDTIKRPDLLVFAAESRSAVDAIVARLGGLAVLPCLPEQAPDMMELLSHAVAGVECENSMWEVEAMIGYAQRIPLGPRARGRHAARRVCPRAIPAAYENALPNIITKHEDMGRLEAWESRHQVPIHVWHAFYDLAFGISLRKIRDLLRVGWVAPSAQIYGKKTKIIYRTPYQFGYTLARSVEKPEVVSGILREGAKLVPYAHFSGGRLELADGVLPLLRDLAQRRTRRVRLAMSVSGAGPGELALKV